MFGARRALWVTKLNYKMSLQSMTGFGRTEFQLFDKNFVIEMASVNQKSLQVSVYGPDEWPTLESMVTNWIKPSIHRGKITVRLTGYEADSRSNAPWNEAKIQSALDELKHIAAKLHVRFEPDARLLLSLAELRHADRPKLPNIDSCEDVLHRAFHTALHQLIKVRQTEGRALVLDLQQRLSRLTELVVAMETSEKGAPARHRQLLQKRLNDSGINLDFNDERILRELALFADRCDITEETVRMKSHLAQFSDDLTSDKVGRKLDFLVQELLREVNTVGSKASEIATTKAVLEAKTEIERIREQVQNLE